jgi:hypothetical protein
MSDIDVEGGKTAKPIVAFVDNTDDGNIKIRKWLGLGDIWSLLTYTPIGETIVSVDASADGTVIYVVTRRTYTLEDPKYFLYRSLDSGATFTYLRQIADDDFTGVGFIIGINCDITGQYIIYSNCYDRSTYSDSYYISSDYGDNFTEITLASIGAYQNRYAQCCASNIFIMHFTIYGSPPTYHLRWSDDSVNRESSEIFNILTTYDGSIIFGNSSIDYKEVYKIEKDGASDLTITLMGTHSENIWDLKALSNTVLIGIAGGYTRFTGEKNIIYSSDSGASFSTITSLPVAGRILTSVMLLSDDNILASTFTNENLWTAYFPSLAGGALWSTIGTKEQSLEDTYYEDDWTAFDYSGVSGRIMKVSMSTNGQYIYITTWISGSIYYLYRSSDSGLTFVSLRQIATYDVTCDSSGARVIYRCSAVGNSCYYSTNYGASFAKDNWIPRYVDNAYGTCCHTSYFISSYNTGGTPYFMWSTDSADAVLARFYNTLATYAGTIVYGIPTANQKQIYRITRTGNGTATETLVHTHGTNIYDIKILDATTLLIVAGDSTPGGRKIEISTDSGATFTPIDSLPYSEAILTSAVKLDTDYYYASTYASENLWKFVKDAEIIESTLFDDFVKIAGDSLNNIIALAYKKTHSYERITSIDDVTTVTKTLSVESVSAPSVFTVLGEVEEYEQTIDIYNCVLKYGDDGKLYLAFKENSGKASVMVYDSGDWDYLGNSEFSEGEVGSMDMVIEGENVYVAYEDIENDHKATVKRNSGGNWTTLGGTSGFSVGAAQYIAIAVNIDVFIAFSDSNESGKASIMKYTNQAGVFFDYLMGLSTGVATDIKLAFASDDSLKIAYKDADESEKATVGTITSQLLSKLNYKFIRVAPGKLELTSTVKELNLDLIDNDSAYEDFDVDVYQETVTSYNALGAVKTIKYRLEFSIETQLVNDIFKYFSFDDWIIRKRFEEEELLVGKKITNYTLYDENGADEYDYRNDANFFIECVDTLGNTAIMAWYAGKILETDYADYVYKNEYTITRCFQLLVPDSTVSGLRNIRVQEDSPMTGSITYTNFQEGIIL